MDRICCTNTLYVKILESIECACTSKDSHIGVAFSGGVDSSLVAKICKNAGYKITLLTVGFAGSHDMEFASKMSSSMSMEHSALSIDDESFADISSMVIDALSTNSISWVENCIAFYYVATLAKSLKISTVLTANGIDELFCGYDSYRRMDDQSKGAILEAMDMKIKNELDMMQAISDTVKSTGVRIVQPLLSAEFVNYAKTIPIDSKIRGSDDMLRKHAIRELADEIGVPKMSSAKRKKALQYGTQIHKNLLKLKSFSRRRSQ